MLPHNVQWSVIYYVLVGGAGALSRVVNLNFPLLTSVIFVSGFGSLLHWGIGHAAARIETVKEETSYMFIGFLSVETFQAILFRRETTALWSWEFWSALAFQEIGSVCRNLGLTSVFWYHVKRVLKRNTTADHPFGSRRGVEKVAHVAMTDGAAELLGALTVFAVVLVEVGLQHVKGSDLSTTCAI